MDRFDQPLSDFHRRVAEDLRSLNWVPPTRSPLGCVWCSIRKDPIQSTLYEWLKAYTQMQVDIGWNPAQLCKPVAFLVAPPYCIRWALIVEFNEIETAIAISRGRLYHALMSGDLRVPSGVPLAVWIRDIHQAAQPDLGFTRPPRKEWWAQPEKMQRQPSSDSALADAVSDAIQSILGERDRLETLVACPGDLLTFEWQLLKARS